MPIQFGILLHWLRSIVCIQGNHAWRCSFSLRCCFTAWELLFAHNENYIIKQHAHWVWHTSSLIEKYCLHEREIHMNMLIQFAILFHCLRVIVCTQWTSHHKTACPFSLAYCFAAWELLFAHNEHHMIKQHAHSVWHTASLIQKYCLHRRENAYEPRSFSLAYCNTAWELLFANNATHVTNQHAHSVWHTASLIENHCLHTRENSN